MISSETLVNPDALERLRTFGGDRLVHGMIALFIANAPRKALEAREALDCGDAAALRAALHGLKSSAGQLGAVTLHHACIAGEELASRGDLGACAPYVERIESDLPAACHHLRQVQPAA